MIGKNYYHVYSEKSNYMSPFFLGGLYLPKKKKKKQEK